MTSKEEGLDKTTGFNFKVVSGTLDKEVEIAPSCVHVEHEKVAMLFLYDEGLLKYDIWVWLDEPSKWDEEGVYGWALSHASYSFPPTFWDRYEIEVLPLSNRPHLQKKKVIKNE